MKMKRFSILMLLVCSMCMAHAEVKYVFFFIGDGMGVNEVVGTEMYQAEMAGFIGRKPLFFTTFPYSGLVSTYSRFNGVTDSSAAGSALSTGKKVKNGAMAMNEDGTSNESIAKFLHDRGWGVGVLTTVTINNATPGAFYAHAASRDMYYEIGQQAAACGYEYLAGAGFAGPVSKTDSTAPNLYDLCRQNGTTIVGSVEEGKKHLKDARLMLVPEKAIANPTKGQGALAYAIDRQKGEMKLSDMVDLGIQKLRHHKRFFMMVEGGKIDHACHVNDMATAIREIQDLDQAVQVAYRFYLQHPDETLIILTCDHETGGMTLGNGSSRFHLQLLQHQQCSLDALSDKIAELKRQNGDQLQWKLVRDLIEEKTGLFDTIAVTEQEEQTLIESFNTMMKVENTDVKTLYKSLNLIASQAIKLIAAKANIYWVTRSHTAAMVPLFAVGEEAERFAGWHDNTQMKSLIQAAIED